MKQETTLREKEVMCLEISATEISGMLKNQRLLTDAKKSKLDLKKESAAKLFSKLEWADFNYKPFRNETSFIDLRGLKAYQYSCPASMMPAMASACEKLVNPLGSIYDRMLGSSSYGLPCDFGLLR